MPRPRCGQRGMINQRQAFATFFAAGLQSGICSSAALIVPAAGLFLIPGICFGMALAHACNSSLTRLSTIQRQVLVVASTVAYFASVVTSLLSPRLLGLNNGPASSAQSGALAGGVGAFIVAIALAALVPALSSPRAVLAVTLTGAGCGVISILVGVCINEYTTFDILAYVLLFPLWQTGVASVIPLCSSTAIPDLGAFGSRPGRGRANEMHALTGV